MARRLPARAPRLKAPRLLATNITALLQLRDQPQRALSDWCHHSEVWISKFLLGKREIQLKDLDRIAAFFGIAVFQLFQPDVVTKVRRRPPARG